MRRAKNRKRKIIETTKTQPLQSEVISTPEIENDENTNIMNQENIDEEEKSETEAQVA